MEGVRIAIRAGKLDRSGTGRWVTTLITAIFNKLVAGAAGLTYCVHDQSL